MMTRKDFERIAQVFRVNQPDWNEVVNWPNKEHTKAQLWRSMVDDMCVELKAINPRFNEVIFRAACRKEK